MDFNYISENDDKLHRDMNEEALFFRQAANGDIPAIRKNLAEKRFRNQSGMGKLSDDPVLNLKYHMVITAGILARVCINRGLDCLHFVLVQYLIKLVIFVGLVCLGLGCIV